MDHPHGSLDDLQPQDLSTCSLPSVIDLTRKGDECFVSATSLEALHMVKNPRWFPNSGNGIHGLPLTDTGSSDTRLASGDRIQPDDAYSNTTVTLSYVSRSHVFSTHDSMSTRSPLYGTPSISKFSLQSSCESENGLGDKGYSLGQHYLEDVDGPLDLASQTQLLQALAQAQVGGENDEAHMCVTQSHVFKGGFVSVEGEADTRTQGTFGSSFLRDTVNGQRLDNGQQCHNWLALNHSSPETVSLNSVVPRESTDSGSGKLLQFSALQEPSDFGDGTEGGELPSQGREHTRPPDDAISPSATSPDYVEDGPVLLQASRSPSAVNSYPDPMNELTADGEFLKDVLPRNHQKNTNHKTIEFPHVNGNATKTLQGNLMKKKLPMRSGRGTRLEAIVMNISPNTYKVSERVRAAKMPKTSTKSTAILSNSANPGKVNSIAGQKKAYISGKDTKLEMESPSFAGKTNSIVTDRCKESTFNSEIFDDSKNSHNSTASKMSGSRFSGQGKTKHKTSPITHVSDPELTAHQRLNLEPEECIPLPDPLPEDDVRIQSTTKSPKKSPARNRSKAIGGDISPTARTKTARPPRVRRKKQMGGLPSTMFSPKEPEIKLKYVNYKEERRHLRLDTFSPFIRMRRQQSSSPLCTVTNYPEEVSPWQKGQNGQQLGSSEGFLPGVVPNTSCLQLGRVSTHSQHQRSLVCCLCGASANAMDLGDLHGPYYPEGYRPSGKKAASVSGLKSHSEEEEEDKGNKEDSSDSDSSSSSCSARGDGGSRACTRPPPVPWPQMVGSHLKHKCASGSPIAKRARMDVRGASEEEDWYSPPVVAQEPCEYWFHEDCSVWSAGVFLVKGKVYGLEEVVKLGQEAICSGCHNPGATLGCFFKGCPNKYHYGCALESDCVLVEENLSMKCKKHKNKTFKATNGNRRDDR